MHLDGGRTGRWIAGSHAVCSAFGTRPIWALWARQMTSRPVRDFARSRMLDPALLQGARRTLQAGTAPFLISDGVLAVQEVPPLRASTRPLVSRHDD
jgi:hypothetical protein